MANPTTLSSKHYPSEYRNPDLVADRIWDRIAGLPIPARTPENWASATSHINGAIAAELGDIKVITAVENGRRALHEIPDTLVKRVEDHKIHVSGDGTEVLERGDDPAESG